MALKTKYRTEALEIMDDFSLVGEELRDALDKIAKINHLLGGNRLTLQGVTELIRAVTAGQEIRIVDVGCGNGDMLRKLAEYGLENHLNFKLIGIDANLFTIQHARQLSQGYQNIEYRYEDIFEQAFKSLKYDILLCTLTLHHFKDPEIMGLLSVFYTNSAIGVLINDLERSKIAYRLFQALCFVFRLNRMSREDGLTSILRGFKKSELIYFSEKSEFKNYKIKWKWAFRYQWILRK